jgi:hypothetical protein
MLMMTVALACSYLQTSSDKNLCAQRIVQCAQKSSVKTEQSFRDCLYQEQLRALVLELKEGDK